jgi:hypothetical protein
MRLTGTEEGGGLSENCFTPLSSSHMYCANAAEVKLSAASAAAIPFKQARFMVILASETHFDFAML